MRVHDVGYASFAKSSIARRCLRSSVTSPVFPQTSQFVPSSEHFGHAVSLASMALSAQWWSGHTACRSIRNGSSPYSITSPQPAVSQRNAETADSGLVLGGLIGPHEIVLGRTRTSARRRARDSANRLFRMAAPHLEIPFVDGHADVWRLFDDPVMLANVAEALVAPFRGQVTKIAGVESRGFILGIAAALALRVGFVPIKKAEGLLPGAKASITTMQDSARESAYAASAASSAVERRSRVAGGRLDRDGQPGPRRQVTDRGVRGHPCRCCDGRHRSVSSHS